MRALMRNSWSAFTGGFGFVVRNRWRILLSMFALALAYLFIVPLVHPLLVAGTRFMPSLMVLLMGTIVGIFISRRQKKLMAPAGSQAVPPSAATAASSTNAPATGTSQPNTPTPAPLVRATIKRAWKPWVILAAIVVPLFGWTIYANTSSWVIAWQMSSSLNPERLDSLPETTNSRLLPRSTARDYAKNANRDNRLDVTDPHLLQAGGNDTHLWWQIPLTYNVWYYRPFGAVKELVRVDAETPDMHIDTAGQSAFFLFGDQSWVTKWHFRVRHPFSEPGEVVYWQKPDGKWVMLMSYVSYTPTWTGTMIPKMAGVMEFGPYGFSKDHSVEEAARLFPGAALHPTALTRQYAEAYATYHKGPFNTVMTQEELFEISEDAKTSHNGYPYFQSFKELGLQQIVPFEPVGGSHALSELLLFDGVTGKVKAYRPKAGESFNGPRKALLNVMNGDPNADWSHYIAVEPRLAHSAKGTYWLITVIRNDPESNAFVMLVAVDVHTLKATSFQTVEKLRAFLNGEPQTQGADSAQPAKK